jgi:hypothetical protein
MTGIANGKNPWATWTIELHRKFMEVVKQFGIESKISYFVAYSPKRLWFLYLFSITTSFHYLNVGAVPKKILQMMNVDYLTRERERVLRAISMFNFYPYA